MMSFAIEVPGEANPLSPNELCRMLHLATSHDHSQRQSAGQQLASWETHNEFYSSLQTLPHEIRLLAMIQLKNGVDKYWRHRNGRNAVPAAQRELVRSRMFQGTVGEEDKKLAMLNAIVLAKLVRADFPQDWPDVMTNLVNLLRSTKDTDQLQLSGALLILLRIVKELGTARLRKSQTALQSVTPELVFLLGEIYTSSTSTWLNFLKSGVGSENAASTAMQNSLTCFKTLRRLLIVGYELPHRDKIVQQVWSLSQTQFGEFLSLASYESPLPAPYPAMVGKHLMQFTKLHVEMADVHPTSFAALPNSFDLVRAYWGLVTKFAGDYHKSGGLRQESSSMTETEPKPNAGSPLLEKLALKGFLLMRICIRMVNYPQHTFKYRSAEVKEEQKELMKRVQSDLLKDDIIIEIANVIISHFLIFRKADMDAWEEDPEEWEQQEESQGNAWEWEVRPCAENVLQHLLVSYKHLLVEPLLAYFETAKDPQADFMKKEAVYTAMGIAAAHVHEKFNFDDFLKSTIANDAQLQGPYCKVLRRRIGILLSLWVPVGISRESRPLVYEIYRHFLNHEDSDNDVVVRITAARQFKLVAEDFAFEGEVYRPFAGSMLTELIQLLQQVDVDETKLAILNTTKVVIERMGTLVTPFSELIIAALPGIWSSAGELGTMLKQAVLTILQSLVMSMKADSQRYHSIMLPIIAEAVKEGSDVSLYLIEEALELWTNVLLQSTTPLSEDLMSLAESAIKQVEGCTEHHIENLTVLGSYIILAPESMLGDRYRAPLLRAMTEAFAMKSREHVAIANKYMETFVRLAEELGGADGLKIVVQDMMTSGFLPRIFENIHDAYLAHQTTGPNRKQAQVSNLILTDYFVILSRVTLADPATFVEMLAALGPLDQVWQWFSSEWFLSFDCMADDFRRKLNLLALTRLLELPQPMQELVLAKLQDYFSMWTLVITPLLEEDNPSQDTLVLTEDLPAPDWFSDKDIRERRLLMSDPLRRVNALNFVHERLGSLVARTGGEEFFQNNYAVNVDSDVLNGFKSLGKREDEHS